MIDFGTVRPGTTLYIPFATYDSNDPTQSVTTTGLATTDIEIYKNGGTTARASDSGYALLGTDGVDEYGTGIHGISVNLSDNTTAGFYAAGAQYWVVLASITVDGGTTVNGVLATFRIGMPDAVLNTTISGAPGSQTSFVLAAGPAEDDALNGCVVYIHDVASAVQGGFAVISDYTGSSKTVTLAAATTYTIADTDNVSIYPPVNPKWFGAVAVTGRDIGASVLLSSGTGTGQLDFTSGVVKSNVTQAGGSTVAAGAIPNAAAGASGGLLIVGSNTGGVTITNSGGAALTLSSSGSNGSALVATGNGSGHGIIATGGATGVGMKLLGGATSGAGLDVRSQGGTGGANYAIYAAGNASGADTGGIYATGGTTGGEGIEAVGTGNGHGLYVVGAGTGEGMHATGGAAANGHGAHFEGVGANSHGLLLTRGGTGGDDLSFGNNDCTVPVVTTVNGLAANTITATAIATGAIDADAIADGAIDAGAFAAGAITATVIADGAIDAATFAAGAIDAAAIAANAIDAATFAADVDAEIATMVWNAATATYGSAGSYGEKVESLNTGAAILADASSDAVIADAVWNALTGSYGTANTYGEKVEALNTGAVVLADASSDAVVADAVWNALTASYGSANTYGALVESGNVGGGAIVAASVTGNVTGSIGSLATQAKADVNAEVLDVLSTDTVAEPAAVIAANAPLDEKIAWLAQLARNKITQTASAQTLFADDATTTVASATVSDSGTVFTRGEWT